MAAIGHENDGAYPNVLRLQKHTPFLESTLYVVVAMLPMIYSLCLRIDVARMVFASQSCHETLERGLARGV